MKTPRIPEKVVQTDIVHLLRRIGAGVYVLGTTRKRGDHPGTMQSPGICDLIVFLRPRPPSASCLLMIEVKAEGGRLSPDQLLFRDRCVLAGVHYVTGNLNAVADWLIEHGYLRAVQAPQRRPA